jgi:hypothetical protein
MHELRGLTFHDQRTHPRPRPFVAAAICCGELRAAARKPTDLNLPEGCVPLSTRASARELVLAPSPKVRHAAIDVRGAQRIRQ